MNDLHPHGQGTSAAPEAHQEAMHRILCEFDRICRRLEIPYFLFAGTLLGAVRHSGFIPWDDDLDVIMLRQDYDRFFREAPALLDRERFFLQQEFTEHWPMFFSKLRLEGTACLESYHPKDPKSHQGVYIDIFPCDNACESALGRKIQFFCSKVVIAKGLDRRGYAADSAAKKIFMAACRLLPNGPFLRVVKGPKRTGAYLHSFLGGASKFSRSVYPARCFAQTAELPFEGGSFRAPAGYDELLRILYDDYMQPPSEAVRRSKKHAILVDLTRSWESYEHYRDNMKFDEHTRSIR